MPKPFKFRYVNEIVGGFVLLTVALLVTGVILAGHYQEWFTPVHTVRIRFPAEGSLGLRKGSEVEILGTSVGQVERIHILDDDSMAGELRIKGDFFRFVRQDSKFKVSKRYQVAGESFLEIKRGTNQPPTDETVFLVEKDTEIIEIAQQLLNQVREATIPLLGQVRLTAEEYGALASDLRSPDGPLMKLLGNLEKMSDGLNKGEGTAGRLLRDPSTMDEVNRILREVTASIEQVQKVVTQVQGVMTDVKNTTTQLPPMAARIGRETEDLPGMMLQTQETLRQAERLIEGIQKHWLLNKYIPQPKPTDLIPPSEVNVPQQVKP